MGKVLPRQRAAHDPIDALETAELLSLEEVESLKEHMIRYATETNDLSALTPLLRQLDHRAAMADSQPQLRGRETA